MKNRYKELTINTIIFACATLCSKAIMFFLLPLYTNVLSKDQYGTVELIISGIDLLTPILTLSITDAILRFGLDKEIPHNKVLKDSFIFLFGIAVIVVILAPLIKFYKPLDGYEWIFAATLIVFMFRSMFTFYLKAIDKNLMFAIDTIVYTALLATLNIVFLLVLKMGTAGYMYSLIIANVVSILFCLIISGAYKDIFIVKLDIKLLGKMIKYSSPLILNAISWWVTHSSDKFMLEAFGGQDGTSNVGLYSAAAKIPALLSAVYLLFSQAWTLSSVKEFDTKTDKNFYSNVFKSFWCIMLVASSVILLIIKPFMRIYVGASFIESWQYVPPLLIAALFGSLSSFFGAVYVATRKNIRCTISTLICAIINIGLNFILIPRYSIMGAAVATAVSYVVIGIYRMLDCSRLIDFKINYLKYGIGTLLVIVQAVLVVVTDYRYLISALTIVALLVIYYKEIFRTVCFFVRFAKQIFHKKENKGDLV